MPATALTPKQERFCLLLQEGASQEHAYVKAGYASQGKTAAENACRLAKNDKVKRRLAELQAKAAARAAVTAESIAAELDAAYKLAFVNQQAAACVAASMGKAKLYGLITDKSQVEQMLHKPSRTASERRELTEEEWLRAYNPSYGNNGNTGP
jgi:phage terminase small subunit